MQSKNRSRGVAAFGKRFPIVLATWQRRGAARDHRFLLPRCPIQLPELLIGLRRAASFGTRQVKNRETSATPNRCPAGTPLVIHERTPAIRRHAGQRFGRVLPLGVGAATRRVLPEGCLPPSKDEFRIRVFRLAACPESWKRNEGLGVNDGRLSPAVWTIAHSPRGSRPESPFHGWRAHGRTFARFAEAKFK